MKQNFDLVFDHLIGSEGGYTNDPDDTGGPTKYGVTIGVLREWRHDENLTAQDVKKITLTEAKAVFKARYWDLLRGDELPSGLDYAVPDYGYNSGVGRAAKALQKQLGPLYAGKVDGILGPLSISACAKIEDMEDFIDIYQDNRLKAIKTFKTYWKHGKGWTRRVAEVRKTSHKLASASGLGGAPITTAAVAAIKAEKPTPMQKPTVDDTVRVQSASKTVAQGSFLSAFGTTATDAAQQLAPHAEMLSVLKYIFIGLTVIGIAVTLYLTARKMTVEG